MFIFMAINHNRLVGESVSRGVLGGSKMDRVLDMFAKCQRRLILFALPEGATKHESDFVFRGAGSQMTRTH